MSRALAPHTVAWLDQVAALVRDHAIHVPISTNDLADLLGLNRYEQQRLWRALDRLAREGHITRITSRHGGCRLWRWIEPPTPPKDPTCL